MKRSILRACALCLTTAFVAGTTWAQDDRSNTGGAAKSGAGQSGASPQIRPDTSPSIYDASVSATATRSGQPVRLSKLMNSNLKGQTGESYGQVQDIIVDPTTGQAQFVVIALSDAAAGAGAVTTPETTPGTSIGRTATGQLVAIPFQIISASGPSDFTALVDRSTLQSAPTFSSTAWPAMDSQWTQRINSHFGVISSTGAPGVNTGTGTGTGVGNPATPGVPVTPGTPDINAPGTRPGSTTPGTALGTAPGTGTGTSPGSGGK
ncbi:MAG TPA: hypothetical protein VK846_17720 [Candidatus Limnocylindria bacterium]|nr:hypothetical protein [Candidatus Limnocylindria bacterium]